MEDAVMDIPELLMATILLMLYTWARYETPQGIRSSTTWSKFFVGRVLYVLTLLTFFTALVFTPPLLQSLLELLKMSGPAGTLADFGDSYSVPLLAALLLTVLLSEFPLLNKLDHAIRDYFHRLAAIPRERRHWIGLLKRAQLEMNEDLKLRLDERMQSQNLAGSALSTQPPGSPGALWLRASLLIDSLERAEDHRKYSDLLQEFSPEYQVLRQQYEKLTPKAQSCLKLLESHPDDQAVALLAKELVEQIENFLLALYALISSLILSCEKTEGRRHGCAQRLGLRLPEESTSGLSIHEVLWISIVIVVVLALTATQLGPDLIILITINSVGAALVALAISDVRSCLFTPKVAARLPPIGSYLVAGIGGIFLSGSFGIFFQLFRTEGAFSQLATAQAKAISVFFQYHWPWTLMYFTTACLVAVLADPWFRGSKLGVLRKRLNLRNWVNPFDAVIVGAGSALTALFATYPLLEALETLEQLEHPPTREGLAYRCLLIGLIVGAFFPLWHRRRIDQEQTREAAMTLDTGRAMILRLEA